MMEAAHTAVGFASGFVAVIFAVGIGLYIWARQR